MKSVNLRMLVAALVLSSVSFVAADRINAQDDRDDNASQIAKAWFTSLMQGETAVTTSLSGVPFAFDSKPPIETHAELKHLYDQVVANKGKRNLKLTSIKIKSSSPEKVEVTLMIENDDEAIVVIVKPGEAYCVVGFTD